MAVRKRSITIAGHRTSYSIEDAFQDGLVALADDEGLSVAALIARIDAQRPPDANLSSALRLYVLQAARAGRLADHAPTGQALTGQDPPAPNAPHPR